MNSTEEPTPPVPSPRPAEEIHWRIEGLARWLDFQFNGPQIGDQVRGIGAEVERLSAELADARDELAAVESMYRAAQARSARDYYERINRVDAAEARAVATERALEAVRAALAGDEQAVFKVAAAQQAIIDAALSAASPTTSDEPARTYEQEHAEYLAQISPSFDLPEHVASDEPARCDHGHTEGHRYSRDGVYVTCWCPGLAASGTPVHNHGPAEGAGLDCPEQITKEGIRGACLTSTSRPWSETDEDGDPKCCRFPDACSCPAASGTPETTE